MDLSNQETYVRYNLADLHMHSLCSDGLRTPTQAVEEACEAGLQAMSLTDHDTVKGIPEAIEAGERLGMEVLPGTELSAHVHEREVHILAYCIDCGDDQLGTSLEQFFTSRHQRGIAIVEKLNGLGLSVSLDDVLNQAKGSPLGRPHIAAAMVQNGRVADENEAFNRYIGDRGPAFKAKPYTSVEDVIGLVHRTGGVAVLAHPGASLPEAIIQQLVSYGLDGVEVFHPAHQPPQIDFYNQLADRYGLLKSGGSDSHGNIDGTRIGDYGVGYEVIKAMRERAATYA